MSHVNESIATGRQIEGLAESSLKALFDNTEIIAAEFDGLLKRIHKRVDALATQSLQAVQYHHQQTEIICKKAREEEERLKATIAHCRELREEFQELKDLKATMYASAMLNWLQSLDEHKTC